MVILTSVLGISSVWLLVSFVSLSKKNQKLNRHLTATESDLLRTKELFYQSEKKLAKNQEQHNNLQSHQTEVFELRRDNSRFKDDLKKLKEDLRIKENEFKRLESVHIDKLYFLTNEKETLLSQLKDLDKASKKQLDEVKYQLEQSKAQILEFQEMNSSFEKQSKSNISKLITLQTKLKIAEQEIEKLNKQNSVPKVEPVDPQLLMRWQERAVCAKKMYVLMKQMRELSDTKVESYQEGIIAIAEWVLHNTNMPMPVIRANENKADRLLAEAWTAVIAGNHINPSINNDANQNVSILS